jgi:sugar phosphate isomerase/epimerase
MNRRTFLLSSTAALAVLKAAPTSAKDRLAVTSWPFRAYIDSPTNKNRDPKLPGMEVTGFPSFVAEKFGVFNINPLSAHFKSTEPAYLETFRASVEKAHSHLIDLGLGGGKFYDPDAETRRAAVENGRKGIDMAVVIGSPSVRQHLSDSRGATRDVALAAASLGELAEYGAKRNIIVNLENDAAISEDPFFLAEILGKVNSKSLRGLPDFGNSLQGHDDAFNEKGVNAMFQYAGNVVHVKDTVQSEKGQVYTVDLKTMFGIAKAHSFKGYFSMDFDTKAGDAITGTQHLIEKSLTYLS